MRGIAIRKSNGYYCPWDEVAGPEDEVVALEDEVEVGLDIFFDVMSADGCIEFDASSDSLYLGALTYPWTWSLSILFTTI
jgi:hypothetical protein